MPMIEIPLIPSGYIKRTVTRKDGSTYSNDIGFESGLAAIVDVLKKIQDGDSTFALEKISVDSDTGAAEVLLKAIAGEDEGWTWSFAYTSVYHC